MRHARSVGALLGLLALLVGSLGPAVLVLHALDHDHAELDVWFHGHEHAAGTPDHEHSMGRAPSSIGTAAHVVHTLVPTMLGALPPVPPQVTRRVAGEAFLSGSPPLPALTVLRI